MYGITSNYFNFCLSAFFLRSRPRKTGNKKSIKQPNAKRPAAQSKFFINHSRVNHSIILIFYNTQVTRVTYISRRIVQRIIDITWVFVRRFFGVSDIYLVFLFSLTMAALIFPLKTLSSRLLISSISPSRPFAINLFINSSSDSLLDGGVFVDML